MSTYQPADPIDPLPGPAEPLVSSTSAASLLPSVTRTVVPLIVGLVITALLKLGISIPSGTVTDIVTTVVTAAYYLVVRYAETHFGAQWGWLLGLAKAPAYSVR